jgi:hypothetical protein
MKLGLADDDAGRRDQSACQRLDIEAKGQLGTVARIAPSPAVATRRRVRRSEDCAPPAIASIVILDMDAMIRPPPTASPR